MSLWKSINIDKDDMIEEYLKYMSATEGEEHADTSHIAHLWQQLGVFLRTIQDYQRSKQCLERGLELYEAYFDPDSPEVARSVYELGVLYIAWKKPQTSEGLLQQALGSFEEAFSPDSWECLRVLKALKTVKEVLHDDEMTLSLESEIVRVQNIVMSQPQNSSSIKAIRKIIKKLESEIEEVESVGTAAALHELATLHAAMNELDTSMVYYGHALNMRESLLGDLHMETVCTLYNMGQVASFQGKLDVACVLWEKAFKNLLQMSGMHQCHPMAYDVIEKLFAVYMTNSAYQSAEAIQRFAVDCTVKEFGHDHIQFAKAMNNYGIVLAHQDKLVHAKKCMETSLSIFRKLGHENSSIIANLEKIDGALQFHK
jgi:tetratricopeptide (TPR) repeat protein